MINENKSIKNELLKLFEEGKNETEAFEEISKKYSSDSISLKTVSNWFEKFSSGEQNIGDKKNCGRKPKFTDEFFINLVNDNRELNMAELAKLVGVSRSTIYNRLKQINSGEQRVSYIKKEFKSNTKKVSDEYLINLVNDNPELNMTELGKLVGFSQSAISNRLKKINSGEQRVNYIKKDFKSNTKKVSDEYLINLVNDNPELNMNKLGKLADISQSVMYNRLKKINKNRPSDNIIVLGKDVSRVQRKTHKTITEEYLIKLINENPELNTYELAKLADVSQSTIYNMLKNINADGQRVNYIKKGRKSGVKKFTDEFLIDLINENPELNITELAYLCNSTRENISRRLKLINIDGKGANYIKKEFKNTKKFTDEFLINLINENPDLSISGLAKLSNTTSVTISRRLKQINCNGERVKFTYKK